MEKLYKAVKQKFEESFKSSIIKSMLEFSNNKIYFMKNMEFGVECDNEYCIIKTKHGKLHLYIKDFDFEKQVDIISSSIFIVVDIISTVTATITEMTFNINSFLGDILSNKKSKEILN